MSRFKVYGYIGDADAWCVTCARERYGVQRETIDPRKVHVGDEHEPVVVPLDTVGEDGNAVTTLYSWDLREWDYPGPSCGGCLLPIE